MYQSIVIVVRQCLYKKCVKLRVLNDQLLKGGIGDLAKGSCGFCDNRKLRRTGVEFFRTDYKLVKADEAVGTEV